MPEVRRWYRFRAKRNVNSADVNVRNLLKTLDRYDQKPPAKLLKMKPQALDEYVQDLVDFLIDEEKIAGSAVKKYIEAIKSFLAWHRRKLERPLNIPGAEDNPNSEAQTIPDQAKFGMLLAACDLRTSVMVALEGFAGVRPQVIGNFDGSNGLVLGDFPELVLTKSEASFSKIPTRIRVRKEISKTRKAYSTFLGPQGCELFLQYLNSRIAAGEILTKASPALTFEDPLNKKRPFLIRANVQKAIRNRMRKVGINDSSYILRSYFDNRVLMAEAHGVPALYREFWMGHKGGMQMRYALRKELPDDVIEDMRRCYGKTLQFLETKRSMESGDPIMRVAEVLLQTQHGYTEAQLHDLELDKKSRDELIALMSKVSEKPKGERSQKIVSVNELESALLDGWIYRASLPDGRSIIERT